MYTKVLTYVASKDISLIVLALLAFLLAAFQVHAIEPGWLFWDSYRQWLDAYQIIGQGATPADKWQGLTSQWPLFMTFSKCAWLWIGLTPAHYGFAQAWLLNFAIGFMAYRITGSMISMLLVVGVIVSNPIVWNYAAFHSSDTLTAAILLFMLGFLAFRRGSISAIGIIATALAICHFRKNGLTILPIVVWLVFIRSPHQLLRKRLVVPLLIVSAVALSLFVESLIPVRRVEVATPGIIRRNFYLFKLTNDESLAKALAMAGVNPHAAWDSSCFETMWCPPLFGSRSFYSISHAATVANLQAYALMSVTATSAWLKTFVNFSFFDLGIISRLKERELGYVKNSDNQFGLWPENDFVRLNRGVYFREALNLGGGVLLRPWIHFALIFVMWLSANHFQQKGYAKALLSAGTLASGIFIPLLFVSLNSEVRYYFPTGLLLIATIITVMVDLVRRGGAIAIDSLFYPTETGAKLLGTKKNSEASLRAMAGTVS